MRLDSFRNWRTLSGVAAGAAFVALCSVAATATLVGADEPAPTLADTPKPSLNLPCEIIEVYDGDTLTVRVAIDIRVRLLNCWAEELHKGGKASKEHLQKIAPPGTTSILEIPLGGATRLDDLFTFGRVIAHVHCNGISLTEEQIASGHAYETKEELKANQ